MKVKIDDWEIKYLKRDDVVCTLEKGVEKSRMSAEDFETWGMVKFPKRFYKIITSSLTNSNTYDRFLDKFYEARE